MRWLPPIVALLLASCGSAPQAPDSSSLDPTRQPWYAPTTQQLADLNRRANDAFQAGKQDQAAALIEQGQPLAKRLLEATPPTLEAMEAVSDLDDLYGRMLLSNRHYGWARLQFQKNLARWKRWKPESEESIRRLKQVNAELAECDRHLEE